MILASAYHHHRAALRASLRAEYGVDLRSPGMNLLDLADLVAWLPPMPKSALFRAVNADEWMWDNQAMLMALVVDAIQHGTWQSARLNPNVKGVSANPPDPIPRPGFEPSEKQHQGAAMDLDEMNEWLGALAQNN